MFSQYGIRITSIWLNSLYQIPYSSFVLGPSPAQSTSIKLKQGQSTPYIEAQVSLSPCLNPCLVQAYTKAQSKDQAPVKTRSTWIWVDLVHTQIFFTQVKPKPNQLRKKQKTQAHLWIKSTQSVFVFPYESQLVLVFSSEFSIGIDVFRWVLSWHLCFPMSFQPALVFSGVFFAGFGVYWRVLMIFRLAQPCLQLVWVIFRSVQHWFCSLMIVWPVQFLCLTDSMVYIQVCGVFSRFVLFFNQFNGISQARLI